MTPALLLLIRAFTTICEHTESPQAVGMLVSVPVYHEFMAWLKVSLLKTFIPTGNMPTVQGIPFHVQEGLACQVVFFTDARVWNRVLQHTDQ